MQALKQTVIIPENHKLVINVPSNISTGKKELFIIFENINNKKEEKKERVFDQLAGKLNIPNDFDEENQDVNKMFYGD